MVPGTHSVWVAPPAWEETTQLWSITPFPPEVPTSATEPCPGDSEQILRESQNITHPPSALVLQWKTMWGCLSMVTGHPWQKGWREQNAQIFPSSWDGRVSCVRIIGTPNGPWATLSPVSLAALVSHSVSVSNDSNLLYLTASFTAKNHTALSDLPQTFTFSHVDIDRHIF